MKKVKHGKKHMGLVTGIYFGYFILFFVILTVFGVYNRDEMTTISMNPFMKGTALLNFIIMFSFNHFAWKVLDS